MKRYFIYSFFLSLLSSNAIASNWDAGTLSEERIGPNCALIDNATDVSKPKFGLVLSSNNGLVFFVNDASREFSEDQKTIMVAFDNGQSIILPVSSFLKNTITARIIDNDKNNVVMTGLFTASAIAVSVGKNYRDDLSSIKPALIKFGECVNILIDLLDKK